MGDEARVGPGPVLGNRLVQVVGGHASQVEPVEGGQDDRLPLDPVKGRELRAPEQAEDRGHVDHRVVQVGPVGVDRPRRAPLVPEPLQEALDGGAVRDHGAPACRAPAAGGCIPPPPPHCPLPYKRSIM